MSLNSHPPTRGPRLAAVALAVIIAATVLAACGSQGDKNVSRGLATELQQVLDQAVASPKTVFPATALSVSSPELGTWSGAAGQATIDARTPMKPDDRFRGGSTLKMFVAVTVLQLVEEGTLSLDDSLPTVLPERVVARFPNAGRITVRMLLNHTSGIADVKKADFEQLVAANPHRIWGVNELLGFAAAQPPVGAPGERYSYSNANYILLGLVIERATGESWRTAVRERVIDRLHLEHTSFPEAGDLSIGSKAAHGYDPLGGKLRDVTGSDPSIFGAAGGASIITTTEDLRRFVHALFAGDLFDRAGTLHKMLTFVPAQDESGMNGYGLGVERYELPGGVEAVGHVGTIAGYLAFAGHLPAQGVDVAMVITSRDDPSSVLLPALKLMITQGQT